jgi:AcrR family transcriptional regulator
VSELPKAPDPGIEERIVAAALRLLDERGMQGITMRSVAAAAGTTTPTIYERFADRQALMHGVVALIQKDLTTEVQSARSVEEFVTTCLQFFCRRRHRFDLGVETFGARLVAAEPRPVYEMFLQVIRREVGASGEDLEELALAVVSLLFGTITGMIAVGSQTSHARDLRRASLAALERLVAAFRQD